MKILKNIKEIELLVLIIGLLIFTSCSKTDTNGYYVSSDYVNMNGDIIISGDATSANISVNADCGWTISDVPSWLSLSAISRDGDTDVGVTLTANPSSINERSATLILSTVNGLKRQFKVIQSKGTEVLSLNTDSLKFISDGESKKLSIQNNSEWKVLGGEDWFSIDKTSGTGSQDINVTVNKNTTEEDRLAILTVQGVTKSSKVVIYQSGVKTTLSVSPIAIKAGAVAETQTITLSGDAAWTASSDATWAILDKLNGTGAASLQVKCEDNSSTVSRQAIITIKTNKKIITCTITQSAGEIPSLSVPAVTGASKYSATITGNYNSQFDVTEYGICYSSTKSLPTISDNKMSFSGSSQSGNIRAIMENLSSLTTYYVCLYAISKVGISYSTKIQFTTTGGVPGSGDNPTPNM